MFELEGYNSLLNSSYVMDALVVKISKTILCIFKLESVISIFN